MRANYDVLFRSSVPKEMQGRVYAVRNTLQFFTIPVGYFLGGFLVDDVLEPVPEAGLPEGYVEISEGEFTKVIQLDTPYELEIVDSLAESGWLLVQIIPIDNKYIYWFQSKRKIYINTIKTHNK